MNQNQVNRKMKSIAHKVKSISTIGLNYMEYLSALIYAIYEIEKEPQNFLNTEYLMYTVQILDEQLYKIRKREKTEKLFINIRFREVIKTENYEDFKYVINEIQEIIRNSKKEILAIAFEDTILEAVENNEISFENTEYYTPQEIVKIMIELLKIKENSSIYNPACGTGNFIVECAKIGNIYAFGEEANISNYNICITNLWLHDITNKRIKENESERMPKVDFAIANPPFALEKTEKNILNIQEDEIYWKYGIYKNVSSCAKFIIQMMENTRQNGKIAVIIPHGFLFKKSITEYNLRRFLVDGNYIDSIISLPEKLFSRTRIPVVILLLDKGLKNHEILYIDASREYIKGRKQNVLSEANQNKIIETYKKRSQIEGYSTSIDVEDVIKNNYDLNVKRYLKIEEKKDDIDINKETRELEELENERMKISRRNRKNN